MWIMVAGPYRAGSPDPQVWQANWQTLNQAAYALFQLGHIPVIGVNMALPIIAAAGEDSYDRIMMPLSLQLTERCDAVLRLGGSSSGADREVERFVARGCPVYHRLEDVPAASVFDQEL